MHRDGSSVMFPLGSRGGVGSCNIRPPHPNDPVGIDLTPTPIPAPKLRIFRTRQMTAEMVLFMGIPFKFWQQTVKAWLLWWLLKLFYKIGRPLCSCFPCRDDVVIRLFVVFFPPLPETSLQLTIKILYINIKLQLKQTDSCLKLKYTFKFLFPKLNYNKITVHKYTITN